jgi:dTDP-4-dehydrorhamnose 3,5-epimerase
MGTMSVNQILVTPLKRVPVCGGDVLHAMKCSDPGFVNFGEAYFSQIVHGAVKGWKRHVRMTLNLIVPVGEVQFVFVDDEGDTREEVVGLDRYVRLTVPPGIWFGFKGLAAPYSLLLNVADIPHDPTEIERENMGVIAFDWEERR